MNICLISEEFPPSTGWGGIATYTYTLAQGLVNLGHQIDVLAGVEYAGAQRNYRLDSINVYRVKFKIPNKGINDLYFKILRRFLNFFCPLTLNHLEFSFAVYRKIRELKQNKILHILESPEYDLGAFFLCFLLKIPVVIKLHTPVKLNYILNELKIGFDVRLHDFLCRLMVKRADLITAPSQAMVRRIDKLWGKDFCQIIVVTNPIDHNKFRPKVVSVQSEYILYVGRLEKRKGAHILLDAFLKVRNDYPSIRLVMIGLDTDTFRDGLKKIFFREYMGKNGIDPIKNNIALLGKLERDEIIGYYQNALFGISPSEDFDNFPYVCLEALSCGLPVVYTRSGGVEEMNDDGKTGIAVSPKDSEDMYLAMLKMLRNSAMREKMRKGARERVENNYRLDICSRNTEKLYKEIMTKNG